MPRSLITDGEVHDTADFAENARRYFRMPGIVMAFYPGVQGKSAPCVDVQPAVHDVRFCNDPGVPAQPEGMTPLVEGQRYSEPWQVLHRIPVRYPSGGGLVIWWDLKPGDRVELEALDLDPSTFRATGQPSDPPLTRRNSGTHWTAVPGDTTDPGAVGPAGGAICVGTPGGVLVTVSPSAVNLGSSAPTDAVALASLVADELTKVATALATLSCPNTGTSTPVPVVAATAYGPPPILRGAVASKIVKAV